MMGPAGSRLYIQIIGPAAAIGVGPRIAKAFAIDPDIMCSVSGYGKGKCAVEVVPAASVASDVVAVHRDRIASPVIGGDGYLSTASGLGSLGIGWIGGLRIVTRIVRRIV